MPTSPALTPKTRQHLKAIGHRLHPVVTVAGKGLADSVLEEIRRGLNDHELIKVKVAVADRVARRQLVAEMCERCDCALVQQIGHVALVYRENPKARLGVSNTKSRE